MLLIVKKNGRAFRLHFPVFFDQSSAKYKNIYFKYCFDEKSYISHAL